MTLEPILQSVFVVVLCSFLAVAKLGFISSLDNLKSLNDVTTKNKYNPRKYLIIHLQIIC
jgi:hypothetical protein